MLTRLGITDYRGFKSYQMAGLAQVNLLVGKNNSGKTALLEGIQFLTSGGDPAVLAEVAERRGEVVLGRPDSGAIVDISHFFHGHSVSSDQTFSFESDNGYTPVSVKTVLLENETISKTATPRARAYSSGLYLKIVGGVRPERDQPLYRISREGGVDFEAGPRYRRIAPRRSQGPQVRFVGPDSLNSVDLAAMWDEVTIAGQEADVAGAMRILEDKLDSLHFLTGMFASGYFPSRGGIVVGIKGQEGRVPLGSMGDGMRRLMALATSLAFTKEGCLFVDEIDTGLHYSVMCDMWKLVIEKAVTSNTQVFATTHSWDCIEGLSILCQREPSLMQSVALHKIDRGIAHSIAFPGESLVRMIKSDIDPR